MRGNYRTFPGRRFCASLEGRTQLPQIFTGDAALCKDAATSKILTGVPVGRCADGATAKFLTGRSYRNRFCVSL